MEAKADKGRTTKAVFIRLSVQEYQWLSERGKGSVAGYVKQMIERAYSNRLSEQNTPPKAKPTPSPRLSVQSPAPEAKPNGSTTEVYLCAWCRSKGYHICPHSRVLQLYNPAIHKAGDRVLMQKGKRLVEAIVPELDADGRPIPP